MDRDRRYVSFNFFFVEVNFECLYLTFDGFDGNIAC